MSETTRTSRPNRVGLPGRVISDRALSRRIAGGDRSAFDEMFRRYHQPIYRFCSAMVGAEEAKDVLQDVMTKALISMPDDGDFQMKPWLYRVARNECIDRLRRSRRVETGLEPELRTDVGNHDPQRAVLQRERIHQLVEDLNGLPERQRSALVMRELSGLSYAEIGATLGASGSSAKQLVYEARLSLEQADLGRKLDCAEVRKSISGNDRRQLRARKVRSHLRSCGACSDFESAIRARRSGFRTLFPGLPAGSMLALAGSIQGVGGGTGSVAGGAAASAAAGGGLAAGGAATGLVTKGVVALVVAGGIGAGVAEVSRDRTGPAPSPDALERTLTPASRTASEQAPARASDRKAPRPLVVSARQVDPPLPRETDRDRPRGAQGVLPSPDPDVPASIPAPGRPTDPGPATTGRERAEEASGTVPGQSGSPPPSRKPVAPPGLASKPPSPPVGGEGSESPGNSGSAPAVGRPDSPGKSGEK